MTRKQQTSKELCAELEERVDDLQQKVRFCTCNYKYHHKNDDAQILEELDAMMQESKAQLAEVFKQMENMEALIENAIQKCSSAEATLDKRKRNGKVTKVHTGEECDGGDTMIAPSHEGNEQRELDGYDSNKENC